MEQVPWDRRISRAHPSKEHLRANRDRNINKDFLFKKKKIFTCLEDEPSHVVAATQSTCSEATGNFLDGEILLQEKRVGLRENLPFHGKMLLALTKMLKITFFRGFHFNSLHHF